MHNDHYRYNVTFLLQVNPKKRVTIKQLLHHEWMMKGYAAPVRWTSRIKVHIQDAVISSDFTFMMYASADN